MKRCRTILLLGLLLLFAGCLGTPEGIEPVRGFELQRYLGTWYEIARLDHRFERGLQEVTAEYSLREDGGVRVVNRGYDTEKEKWSEAEGKAYFVEDETVGHLKVSFFGPFYGSYVIFELDLEDYQYAFVCSNNTDYLWFLSRTPTVDTDLKERFLQRARELGFATDDLIFVEHDADR